MIRVDADRLRAGIADLFAAAGMDADKAAVVAEMLVEADLIGHSTHGSGLVEGYLDALASGELNGAAPTRSWPIAAPASPGAATACPAPGWCVRRSISPASACRSSGW